MSHVVIEVEDIVDSIPLNYREKEGDFTYNNVCNNLKKNIKLLQIKLEGYAWGKEFYFLDECRWIWIENSWYCIPTGGYFKRPAQKEW
jgi:hypothetical protein